MIYRQAKLQDLPQMVELAAEAVSAEDIGVPVCKDTIKANLAECIGSPQHFAWVAEDAGKLVAAVVSRVSTMAWSSKKCANGLMWFTRQPGTCMPLLRKLSEWLRSRPGIKVATLECVSPSPSMRRAMSRLGFARESTNLVYVRS